MIQQSLFWVSIQNFWKHLFIKIYVHCSTIHRSQDMEKKLASFNGWLDKEDMVHIYNVILLSHRKDKILPFVTTHINLENIMLSKINQMVKDKNRMILVTYVMWNRKQQTSKTNSYTHNSTGITRGEGRWREDEEGKGGHIQGDGRRLDFGWWAHSAMYRWCVICLFIWNSYNVINQCHPNKFNFTKLSIIFWGMLIWYIDIMAPLGSWKINMSL